MTTATAIGRDRGRCYVRRVSPPLRSADDRDRRRPRARRRPSAAGAPAIDDAAAAIRPERDGDIAAIRRLEERAFGCAEVAVVLGDRRGCEGVVRYLPEFSAV